MEKKDFIIEKRYGNVTVVENRRHQWAVIDDEGNYVVPFGKYGWIDGFDSGLARVRTQKDPGIASKNISGLIDFSQEEPLVIEGKENLQKYYDEDRKKNPDNYAKWGIINEKGEEVLPVIYDAVWGFLGKGRFSTTVEKDGVSSTVYFHDLNPELPVRGIRSPRSYSNYDNHRPHYGEYAGSYAQDVMGFSDDVIDDAFDGDPDAYWNID